MFKYLIESHFYTLGMKRTREFKAVMLVKKGAKVYKTTVQISEKKPFNWKYLQESKCSHQVSGSTPVTQGGRTSHSNGNTSKHPNVIIKYWGGLHNHIRWQVMLFRTGPRPLMKPAYWNSTWRVGDEHEERTTNWFRAHKLARPS